MESKEQKIKLYFDAKQKIGTITNERSATLYDTEGENYAYRFGSLESAMSRREKSSLRRRNDLGSKRRNS